MSVLRIVPNIGTEKTEQAQKFYGDLLELNLVMDHGWILTFASDATSHPQISIASEGGAGTAVPDLSIEVDNLDEIYQRAKSMDFKIVYEITDEPWGVRRFFVEDPFGKIINMMSHQS